jgi:hypothetical protein
MPKTREMNREQAETLAIRALSFLARDPERFGRFLALSGIGPESIRAAAGDPAFLAGVLDHLAGDERLLIAFADEIQVAPAEIERARAHLAGNQWERDVP